MIPMLYDNFKHWTKSGSVYLLSDPHFDDTDCLLMDKNWISAEAQLEILNKYIKKNDTFVCLGDVGNLKRVEAIKGYKVLITGNHDDKGLSVYKKYFDEVYDGPLFVAPKILLSHEPIFGLNFCMNIHGHNHNKSDATDEFHKNIAANICNYTPINLGKEIKNGLVSKIETIHRITIDSAVNNPLPKD